MLSRKDLRSEKIVETVRISKNSTKIITANGEVQKIDGATMYVHD